MWAVRYENGPPLSVGGQLRRAADPQDVLALPVLRSTRTHSGMFDHLLLLQRHLEAGLRRQDLVLNHLFGGLVVCTNWHDHLARSSDLQKLDDA